MNITYIYIYTIYIYIRDYNSCKHVEPMGISAIQRLAPRMYRALDPHGQMLMCLGKACLMGILFRASFEKACLMVLFDMVDGCFMLFWCLMVASIVLLLWYLMLFMNLHEGLECTVEQCWTVEQTSNICHGMSCQSSILRTKLGKNLWIFKRVYFAINHNGLSPILPPIVGRSTWCSQLLPLPALGPSWTWCLGAANHLLGLWRCGTLTPA